MLKAAESANQGGGDLDVLYRAHSQSVYRAAYRVTGNAMDAEDVLQTVFLRLVKREGPLDLSPSPAAYLHRAAVNAALDIVRSRVRQRAVALDETHDSVSEDIQETLIEGVREKELREQMRTVLAELSPRTAEMFVLRYFEDFDTKEVAERTGAHHTVVAVLLHRARNRMEKEIAQLLGRQK